MKFLLARLSVGFSVLLLVGCTTYGVIDNAPRATLDTSSSYSIRARGTRGTGDISLVLAFSGGGTRAAALSYGVLRALRDITVRIDGRPRRLLDEIDVISSVSGGSFTSAYYGLFGERIFEDFETAFLRRDVQHVLIHRLLSPLEWFSSTGRTEMAIRFYEETVFQGATFDDMLRVDGPLILINTSDLGYGVRFSFIQEYFNLLCSDISSFPVARAVAASSAVPVLFNPVVVQNYFDCKSTRPDWLLAAEQRAANDPELDQVVEGLETYFEGERRQYAHFVDGGITDNLGLRAIYEIIEVAGGVGPFMQAADRQPPRELVIIAVDASTEPEPAMDLSNRQPSIAETIGAVTDVQLHRYNVATLDLMDQTIRAWAEELSTPTRPIDPHLIWIGFKDIEDPVQRQLLNQVPTSFNLSDEQVDALIATGQALLLGNATFQGFLDSLGGIVPPEN